MTPHEIQAAIDALQAIAREMGDVIDDASAADFAMWDLELRQP